SRGGIGIPSVPTSPMSPSKLAQHWVCQMSKARVDEHLRQFRNTAWAPPRTVCATAARQIVTPIWVCLCRAIISRTLERLENKSGLLDSRQPSSTEHAAFSATAAHHVL